ncbi:MAG: methylamine utilization protein [Aureliella sp.]
MYRLLIATLLAATAPIQKPVLRAAEWADLKVKIIYDGPAPKLALLGGSKEPFCANQRIPDERMIVGKQGQLANFAMIMNMRRSDATDIHPDLKEPPEDPLVITSKNCLYKPRVALVRTGQTVLVENGDACGHNFKIDPFSNSPVGRLIPIGGPQEFVFEVPEHTNFTEFSCTIHPWMKGQLIIRDHPYVGISGPDGVVTIEKLPAGEVTFKLAHENMKKSIDGGKLDGKKARWRSGYIEFELKPGMNTHTLTLAPDLFED